MSYAPPTAREFADMLAKDRADQIGFEGFRRTDPQREAIEQYRRDVASRRHHNPLPAGGLFDEVARAQQDLFT